MLPSTPSPWIVEGEPGQGLVLSVYGQSQTNTASELVAVVYGRPEHQAGNGALIGASPLMYAAMKAFFLKWEAVLPAIVSAFHMQQVHGMPYHGPTLADELEQMRAAMNQAEGEL